MFPSDLVFEHQIQFSAGASKSLRLGLCDLILVAHKPTRGERVGAEYQKIKVFSVLAAVPLVCQVSVNRVDFQYLARQVSRDFEFIVDCAEFLCDSPDAAFDESVIAVKYRS
ncbi:MAG: hypothetical protein IID38_07290 [Planctomycetes bacterium]|nr:hypothetical protein [Planctomycetota bacterium]